MRRIENPGGFALVGEFEHERWTLARGLEALGASFGILADAGEFSDLPSTTGCLEVRARHVVDEESEGWLAGTIELTGPSWAPEASGTWSDAWQLRRSQLRFPCLPVRIPVRVRLQSCVGYEDPESGLTPLLGIEWSIDPNNYSRGNQSSTRRFPRGPHLSLRRALSRWGGPVANRLFAA